MSSDSLPVIGFLCGSLRTGSINKQLEKALIKRFKRAGFKTTSINLGRYDLPLYHGDLSMPAGVKALARKLKSCDGVIVVSPEYNGGLTPLLKNAFDWVSTLSTEPFKAPYWGIAACSPGAMSGIMAMRQTNYILTRLGAHVSPIQVGVGNAEDAFDASDELITDPAATLAEALIENMRTQV